MQEKRNKKGQTLLLPVLCCHISKSWTKIEEECSRYPRTTDSASRIRRSYTLTAPSAKPTTIGLTAESCTNAVSRLFDYVRIVGESQLEKKIRLHVRGTSSLVSIDVLRISTNLKRPCCLASVRWWSSYSYIGAKSYSLSVIGSVPRPETRGGMSAETTRSIRVIKWYILLRIVAQGWRARQMVGRLSPTGDRILMRKSVAGDTLERIGERRHAFQSWRKARRGPGHRVHVWEWDTPANRRRGRGFTDCNDVMRVTCSWNYDGLCTKGDLQVWIDGQVEKSGNQPEDSPERVSRSQRMSRAIWEAPSTVWIALVVEI